jgi:hypothetical protein
MLYIGVDNGLQGAVVVINDAGKVVAKYPGSEYTLKNKKTEYVVNEMVKILSQYDKKDVALVIVEKSQSYPGQGSCSMHSVGFGNGLWVGIVAALGFPMQVVHPKTWQKLILRDMDRTDTKAASTLFAQRMRPEVDWRNTARSKKISDGLTDSYCMALYAKRIHG